MNSKAMENFATKKWPILSIQHSSPIWSLHKLKYILQSNTHYFKFLMYHTVLADGDVLKAWIRILSYVILFVSTQLHTINEGFK